MGIFKKARTGTGWFLQIIGGILFIGGGLVVFVWALRVLFDAFGAWTILICLMLAPITYIASIFIVWFTTDNFPFLMLLPYLASFLGAGLIAAGSTIKGDE